MPDAFIFATLLTVVVFLMALGLTDAGIVKSIVAWGDGLKALMAFIGQLAFTLVASIALANTRPVQKLLRVIASTVNSDSAAYALVCFITAVASWISWAFGLAIGGLLAREMAYSARKKGIRLHYPLVVASAYSGFVIWHMGYSGSAQLFVATKGHAFEKAMGVLPVSETIFAPYNLIAAAVIAVTLPFVMAMLKPKPEETQELPANVAEEVAAAAEALPQAGPKEVLTPAQRLERMRWINIVIAAGLAFYLGRHFYLKGLDLNLDIVNWTFLCIGLLFSRSPIEYVGLVTKGSMATGQIIVQYPLYAGIMGLMTGTGLVKIISDWFVVVATAQTLPFWAFLSGGFINMFIPSGGGQWSVQGPIFIEAAKQLGTPMHGIVNGIAYGDQWTNMIQPFFTIPILAVAGLRVRDIMGYCFITLIWTGVILTATLLLSF